MKSPEPTNEPSSGLPAGGDGVPADDPSAIRLRALLEPLADLALHDGVQLPALIDALKLALVRAAIAGVSGAGPASDSRIAVMTGVHRKDVRRIRGEGMPKAPRGASIATQVFARWRSDPAYLTARGKPRQLRRQASVDDPAGPSFESLAQQVTRDVHPRAILDELLRLGMVAPCPGDRLRLARVAFVPSTDDRAMAALGAANLGDHASAIAANLKPMGSRFLEQAIFSDELSAASAVTFNRASMQAWEQVYATMMPLVQDLFAQDRTSGADRRHRVRLGMYSWVASADAPSARSEADRSEGERCEGERCEGDSP